MADSEKAQAEAHGQRVKEKAAREARGPQIFSWPIGPDGEPMAIVMGSASDLVPTVQFGNVCIGPVNIMRPVKNPDDIDELAVEAAKVQKAAEFVIATERRLVQWAMDPSSKLEKPSEQEIRTVNEVAPPPPAS